MIQLYNISRYGDPMQNPIYIGNWLLDVHEGTLVDGDVVRRLDHTPLQLLLCLIRHTGEDVSKQQLLDEVWPRKVVTEDAISVAISQIRKALGDNARRPEYIKTLPGYGYRLIAAVAEVPSPRHSRIGWHWGAPVLLFLGITLAASWWLMSGKVTSNPMPVETAGSSAPPVIAVLPIGDPSRDAPFLAGRQQPYLPPEQALDHYQRGRYLLVQAEPEHGRGAVTAFEQALAAAPDFAPAYVGLAQARIRGLGNDGEIRRALPELRHLLEKALQLDPALADAHLELANLVFLYEWDFPSAERHFKAALASNPSHGLAHFHYSQFLLAMGRFDESMHEVRAYRTLDPFSYSYSVPSVAWIYNMMGAYPQALAELDKRMPLQKPSLVHLWSRQAILENMGREAESFRAYLQVLAEMDYGERELAAAERAFADSGLSGFYRWLAFEKRELRNIGQYQAPLSLARYAVAAGEQERALEWLQQALQARQLELLWVAVDPKYAPLRGRPEFTALLREIGLPQGNARP